MNVRNLLREAFKTWLHMTDRDWASNIIAGYWWCYDHNRGQASEEYEMGCRFGRIYSPGCSSIESEPVAKDIYQDLCARAGCNHD